MPKLSKSAPESAKKDRMEEEMHKFKTGRMHSGSKKGPVVTKKSQALAIALSESGQSKDQKRKSPRKSARRSGR